MKKVIVFAVVSVLVLFGTAFAEEKGSRSGAGSGGVEADTAAIQRAMSQYINAKTSPGTGTYDIAGTAAQFDYIHDGVEQKGSWYVSCVDFKAGEDVYDIDYYVAKKNGNYEVVKEVLHKKNGETINKVLYHAEEKKGSGMREEKKGSGMREEKKGSGMREEKKGSGAMEKKGSGY